MNSYYGCVWFFPKNDICPHGNLPGAYFMQQYRNTVLAERWVHFRLSIRCMMWSRGVLREFDSVLREMTWFCIRLMKSTAMCTFAVFAHAVEIWIYICRSRVRAWSKTKRAARQLPIRKHREERENGIASAVPFSLFSIDAVTFDISKAPMPL